MTSNRSRLFKLVSLTSATVLILTACSRGSANSDSSADLPKAEALTNQQPVESVATNNKLEVTLTAEESMVPFGDRTRWAMTYNGNVVGPTIRIHPGDQLTIHLVNKLAKPTSLHTHGLHVSPDVDDPFLMVEPGQTHTYVYDIPANQQAGTFWYHPHVHEVSAEQVASGLVGAIIVENSDDAKLQQISTDQVLVLTDPTLSETNPWGSSSGGMMMGNRNSGVSMMTQMMGRTGPYILANGDQGVVLQNPDQKLTRVHIVNATSSTRMKLAFSGAKMLQLSVTGGRLPTATEVQSVQLESGERTELILIPNADGGKLTAQRLSNELTGSATNDPEVIATVDKNSATDSGALQESFISDVRNLFSGAEQVAKTRTINLDGHMNPTIDGKLFDPNEINFTAKLGTTEEWVIKNNTPMYHPIHLHTWPFQIEGVAGWQDIVVVPPNSEKRIRVAYEDFGGKTVLHCHILDHEDTGMMAVIKVE